MAVDLGPVKSLPDHFAELLRKIPFAGVQHAMHDAARHGKSMVAVGVAMPVADIGKRAGLWFHLDPATFKAQKMASSWHRLNVSDAIPRLDSSRCTPAKSRCSVAHIRSSKALNRPSCSSNACFTGCGKATETSNSSSGVAIRISSTENTLFDRLPDTEYI